MKSLRMTAAVLDGTVAINGVTVDVETTSDAATSRSAVVTAINSVSDRTGVTAIDTGSDANGVTLVASTLR